MGLKQTDILVWHSKYDSVYYDASTPVKMLAAYGDIFKEMEDQGDYELCPPETAQEKSLYKKAKQGDLHAARIFIIGRRDYEYENVSVDILLSPLG